jgi:hypothetical protein
MEKKFFLNLDTETCPEHHNSHDIKHKKYEGMA